MKLCEIELSEKVIELLEKCYRCGDCKDCHMYLDCIISILYEKIDHTKYNDFDFFLAFDEVFGNV